MSLTPIQKKVPRNQLCPCGSKRKYKYCCIGKDFEYELTETGSIIQSSPINEETAEVLQAQRLKFTEKFGREPGPKDPIFFDPDYDTPVTFTEEKATSEIIEAMRAANVRPELIYAFEKTGLILVEGRENMYPEKDIKEYNDAISEYFELNS